LRARDLKLAVRALQDNVLFTLTAVDGEQRSARRPMAAWSVHQCFLEVLGGQVQPPPDGVIRLNSSRSCG